MHHFLFSLAAFDSPAKDPVAFADGLEVFLLDPVRPFIRMSSFSPVPERFVGGAVRIGKSVFATYMTVVVGSAPNDRV